MVPMLLMAGGLALALFGLRFMQSADVRRAMASQRQRKSLPALPGLAALILGTALILAAIDQMI